MTKLKFISFLITLLAVIILISLGIWQINRLNEKNFLIKQINYSLNSKAKDFFPDFKISENLYSKYKINGNFLADKNILLYSSNPLHPEKHGYFIITPFKTNEGKIIFINRGWASQLKAKTLNAVSTERTIIEVMTIAPTSKNLFIPENDKDKNVWLYIDLKSMADYVKLPAEQSYYMVLIENNNLNQDLYLKSPKDFIKIRNDHLWYAITWFSLAIAVCIIYYIKVKKSKY